jgi:hypothetical protein
MPTGQTDDHLTVQQKASRSISVEEQVQQNEPAANDGVGGRPLCTLSFQPLFQN